MKSLFNFAFLTTLWIGIFDVSYSYAGETRYDLNGNQVSSSIPNSNTTISLATENSTSDGGDRFSISVIVNSSLSYSIQWDHDSVLLSPTTPDTVVLSSLGPSDVGTYTVTVSFSNGSQLSDSVEVGIDTDIDGLADEFELLTFGSLEATTGAEDWDNDGVSNFDEWQEETDATANNDFRPRLFLGAEGGMILPDPLNDSYALNDLVTLTALPFDGRGFYGWYGNINRSPSSPHSIVMDGNKEVSANFNYHGILAWGFNDNTQLNIPEEFRSVVSIDAGYDHALALHSDGSISGWGSNTNSRVSDKPSETGFVDISAGDRHNLALHENGSLTTWGFLPYELEIFPETLSPIVDIDCGEQHNLVLLKNGTVVAWGYNNDGQTNIPVGLNTVIQISAGDNHSLALRADGQLFAWGDNSVNQLNVPGHTSRIVDILATEDHSLALLENGTVLAWGRNNEGQCDVPTGLSQVIELGGGTYSSMALKEDGSVVAWGDDSYGEIDFVTALPKVELLDGGPYFSIALGELEVSTDSPVFIGIPTLLGATDTPFHHLIRARNSPTSYAASGLPTGLSIDSITGLISGSPTTSGTFPVTLTATNANGATQRDIEIVINPPVPLITSSLTADSWIGSSFSYQTTAEHSPISFAATGLPVGLSINTNNGLISGTPGQTGTFDVEITSTNAYGSDLITLELEVRDGSAWGANDYGQTQIPTDLSNVVALYGGYYHSLALRADGSVQAWGRNTYDQSEVPVSLDDVVMLDGGDRHSLALKSDGTIVAWGSNSFGQLNVPAGITDFVSIAAGGYFSLGLRADGTVLAWGRTNDGETAIPSTLNGVLAISAGEEFGIALKSDGSVIGWGNNDNGQTTIPSELSDVVAIDCGRYHVLALKRDGTVVAWGSNTDDKATVPDGLTDIIAISAGDDHSMALKSNGEIVVWGGNLYGQTDTPTYVEPTVWISAGGWHNLSLPDTNPLSTAPQIINRGFAIGGSGKEFNYRVQTRNTTTSFSASGLPSGLQIDPTSGLISGISTQTGSFPTTITAQNTNGSTSQALTIVLHEAPPTMEIPSQLIAYEGLGFIYQLTSFNDPSFSASALPPGLNISTDGVLSGAPATGSTDTYSPTIQLSNNDGVLNETINIEVFTPISLTNGAVGAGALANNEFEVYRFSGNAGDPVSLRIASPTDREDLYYEVFGPDGLVITQAQTNYYDQRINLILPENGTYGLRIRSWFTGRTGSIDVNYYNLLQPFTPSPGDDSGELTSSQYQLGSLTIGDIDIWSFDAEEGDQIEVRVASQQNSSDDLFLSIYNPSGELVSESSNSFWDQIGRFQALETGRYTARVQMWLPERSSNSYRIELANTQETIAPPNDDEGGTLNNGVAEIGSIVRGDIDLWSFSASQGDHIALRVASQQGSSDDLQLRVFSPSGTLVSEETTNRWDQLAYFEAPETGIYVARLDMYYLQDLMTDTYRIELSHFGDSIQTIAGDEGGALIFGVQESGTILRGDVDTWTVPVNRGDRVNLNATGSGIRVNLQAWNEGQGNPHSLTNTTSGNLQLVSTEDGDLFVRYHSWYIEDEGTYTLLPTVERAPVLSELTNQSIPIEGTVSFTVTAQQGDTGIPVLSATNLPPGATFNPETGQFNWIVPNEAGSSTFEIRATAGALSDYQLVTIQYFDPNALSNYSDWVADFVALGLEGSQSGKYFDADRDGLNNYLEYASGNSPIDPSKAEIISVLNNSSNFTSRLRNDIGDARISLRYSENLTNWNELSLSYNQETSQWLLENNPALTLNSQSSLADSVDLLSFSPIQPKSSLFIQIMIQDL